MNEGVVIIVKYNPDMHAMVSLKDLYGEINSWAYKLVKSQRKSLASGFNDFKFKFKGISFGFMGKEIKCEEADDKFIKDYIQPGKQSYLITHFLTAFTFTFV